MRYFDEGLLLVLQAFAVGLMIISAPLWGPIWLLGALKIYISRRELPWQ